MVSIGTREGPTAQVELRIQTCIWIWIWIPSLPSNLQRSLTIKMHVTLLHLSTARNSWNQYSRAPASLPFRLQSRQFTVQLSTISLVLYYHGEAHREPTVQVNFGCRCTPQWAPFPLPLWAIFTDATHMHTRTTTSRCTPSCTTTHTRAHSNAHPALPNAHPPCTRKSIHTPTHTRGHVHTRSYVPVHSLACMRTRTWGGAQNFLYLANFLE